MAPALGQAADQLSGHFANLGHGIGDFVPDDREALNVLLPVLDHFPAAFHLAHQAVDCQGDILVAAIVVYRDARQTAPVTFLPQGIDAENLTWHRHRKGLSDCTFSAVVVKVSARPIVLKTWDVEVKIGLRGYLPCRRDAALYDAVYPFNRR